MKRSKVRKRTTTTSAQGVRPRAPFAVSHPAPRTPQEAQQLAEDLRRERALPWTDDKPFSMWKS